MKTLLTVALASALSFSSLVANASEDLRALSTVNSNYKKISVTLNEGVGSAKISIMDQNGKVLSNRKVRVKGENLMVPYDMNNLPAGEYHVKIVTDTEEVTYKVATTNKPIPTADLPLMAYGKMVDENTVSVTVVGLMEPGADVEVYSVESGKKIFVEHIDQAEGFKKDYSFNHFNSKDVYLKVIDNQGRSKTLYF
ncbi:T9SS type A sorting domain-containing protein [Algoriphagus sp. D3-2-R+10]|uniref:T9SS type A sorting domain-containing protein n=1 Tax=Algoriphagus aurantiacus TaxID=3103948 RepID=UPI002B3C1B84|nr:T9SS type A sorting domain-containing protein [Algoriphagus sp. D3-2-R+10]MEB2775482.1 T9SS type A sorting domain-containing protein [Algoriphagus sp. D3-2-R+10]